MESAIDFTMSLMVGHALGRVALISDADTHLCTRIYDQIIADDCKRGANSPLVPPRTVEEVPDCQARPTTHRWTSWMMPSEV